MHDPVRKSPHVRYDNERGKGDHRHFAAEENDFFHLNIVFGSMVPT